MSTQSTAVSPPNRRVSFSVTIAASAIASPTMPAQKLTLPSSAHPRTRHPL
jgi:hypothetical protein